MKKRRRSSTITGQPGAPPEDRLTSQPSAPPVAPGIPQAPDVRLPVWQRVYRVLVIGFSLLVVLPILAAMMFSNKWSGPLAPGPAQLSDDEVLCDRFVRLRNAGHAAADALLGRVPVVPDAPVSPEEANRLQTDFFLREPVEIRTVERAPGGPPRFVLAAKGNVAAPALSVRTSAGVERSQRTMTNPDLVVEVRDGKIYGVRSELHMGP
jgi:hypothetical protein